jgi:hypothetical protein
MDAVAEQPTQTEQGPPVEKPRSHRFTSANAAAMCRLGWERRRQRQAEQKANPAPLPVPTVATGVDTYVHQELTDARAELQRLKGLAQSLTDPAAIERMARAIGLWSERERILAGRPLPGSQRPGPPRQSRSAAPQIVD